MPGLGGSAFPREVRRDARRPRHGSAGRGTAQSRRRPATPVRAAGLLRLVAAADAPFYSTAGALLRLGAAAGFAAVAAVHLAEDPHRLLARPAHLHLALPLKNSAFFDDEDAYLDVAKQSAPGQDVKPTGDGDVAVQLPGDDHVFRRNFRMDHTVLADDDVALGRDLPVHPAVHPQHTLGLDRALDGDSFGDERIVSLARHGGGLLPFA